MCGASSRIVRKDWRDAEMLALPAVLFFGHTERCDQKNQLDGFHGGCYAYAAWAAFGSDAIVSPSGTREKFRA